MLTLTQDGCECQAAQDERDYPPKSHLFLIYRSKNTPQMIQAFHQAAVGVLTVAAEREVVARGPNLFGSQLGQRDAFKSNWSRWFIYVLSVRSKTCRLLPTVSRLLVWKTLLIPEVIFTGQFTRGGEISTGGRVHFTGISPRSCSVWLRLYKRSMEMLRCSTTVSKIPFPAFKEKPLTDIFCGLEPWPRSC